jgi:hypothetical protein
MSMERVVRFLNHVIMKKEVTRREYPSADDPGMIVELDGLDAIADVYRRLGRVPVRECLERRRRKGLRFFEYRSEGGTIASTWVIEAGERFIDESLVGFRVPDRSIWIRDLYVRDDRRKQGVFGRLTDGLLARHFPAAEAVWSDTSRPPSAHAHARNGFHRMFNIVSVSLFDRWLFVLKSTGDDCVLKTSDPVRRFRCITRGMRELIRQRTA